MAGEGDTATDDLRVVLARIEAELLLLGAERARSEPGSPVKWSHMVPVLVAVIGALGTVLVDIWQATINAKASAELEAAKLRSSVILAAISTGDRDKALTNLEFFSQLGFIDLSPARLAKLKANPASVPVLPQAGAPTRPMTQAERRETLGEPRYTVMDDGQVSFADKWDEKNVIAVTIPQLQGIRGAPPSGTIRFHRIAAEPLKAAFAEIAARGLTGDVTSWMGGYVPRVVRTTKRLSSHALGIAFDINVAENPFGRPAPPGAPGSLSRLIPIFERHGFYWGGRFTRPDPSHFEYGVAGITPGFKPAAAPPS